MSTLRTTTRAATAVAIASIISVRDQPSRPSTCLFVRTCEKNHVYAQHGDSENSRAREAQFHSVKSAFVPIYARLTFPHPFRNISRP